MDFAIFPFVMIMACVVMMVLMMRRMGPVDGGRWAALWSGQMGCCGLSFCPRNERTDRLPSQSSWRQQPTSGNLTFDEYRAETLRRLEQEQRDFQDFLGRLCMAKDKAEFDQFMTERRSGQERPQA
jgi:Protein of unknown function (DUF2852)/Protein of unknown function (DUF2933)